MSRLEAESKQQYVRSEYLAMGHGALGDMEKAFERWSGLTRRGHLGSFAPRSGI